MTSFASTLAIIWRLAIPYFRSEDRWPGRILLGVVIAIELSIVAINVLLNQWNARFFNAVQDRNWDLFTRELLIFSVLATAFIILAVYQLYLNQWLQIRWRKWMTARYLAHWLDSGNHYRMQLLGEAADNPDQRIADDIRMFVERTLTLGIGIFGSAVSVLSFLGILWVLSESAPLPIFGTGWSIPGYLVWAALIYSVVGTVLAHLIGRALIRLDFLQQRYEADFRFNLVRVRENSEQIALLAGEKAEQIRLMDRFAAVIGNWLAIMSRQKKLTFFTAGFAQISIVFPYIVVSPAYFAGLIQLGGLTQTASAFDSVQRALSFFVDIRVYAQFAEWQAVIQRLAGFDAAMVAGQRVASAPPVVSVKKQNEAASIAIENLMLDLPTGAPLVEAHDVAFAAGERVLVTGPTGSGKSTLFRAIAGIWPFGSGTITAPANARVTMLPQRPYFPIESLAAAMSYPVAAAGYDRASLAEALVAVGLPGLAQRLDEEAHWNRMLSLGEQQRIGIARAILLKPDYLFLDEATASLDEEAEATLYRLIYERLPNATVVSIGHRSTLHAFHRRRLELKRDDGRYRVEEGKLQAAVR